MKKYKEIALEIRKKILQMHQAANASHIGSSLSVTDILVALYFHVLKIDPKSCNDKNRDRLILSKGHAASVLYAILAKRGFFAEEILAGYCAEGGLLPGHVTRGCVNGVEVSTGSLGHGLSIGAGLALAARHDKLDYRTFVILSDGECNEGSVWEAAMFAKHHQLDNLVAIIDCNKIQAFGRTEEVLDIEPLATKWQAFGWEVKELDGHDYKELIDTLTAVPFEKNKPSVIIADTVKGKGVSFMENDLKWHYKSPDAEELKKAIKELDLL